VNSTVKFSRYIVFLCFTVSIFFSCGSTPKQTDADRSAGSAPESPQEPDVSSDGGTSIKIDKTRKSNRTYFSEIDGNVMAAVENGSPDALRSAVQQLRKSELNYTETEKVLLSVTAAVMEMTWPSEKIDWEIPEVTTVTPYLGAIDSARKGVYDLSTGNVDFLTLVLPSLVILSSDSVSDYTQTAEQALLASLRLHPGSVLAQYLLGSLYVKTGRASDALSYLTAAAQGAPSCFETAYAQANCLKRLGRMEEASGIAGMLIARYPSDIRVLKLCAETSFALKSYSSAEEYVARVLQKDPNDLEYVLFRARILAEKGDYIRAAALLDVYARQNTTSRDYLLLRARIQRDWSKNIAAAVSTIESALVKYPDDTEVLLFAAQLASATDGPVSGRTSEQLAEAVLAVNPDNTEALRYQIAGMVDSGSWQKAYTLSKKLLAKDASHETAFMHIRICLELAKRDEAWNLIVPLYRDNPDDEDVLQLYIIVLTRTDRASQALSLINTRLPAASPKMKSFFYYRRSFLDATQEESLADLRSSLIANPRNSDALYRLYQLYFDQKDYRKAQYYLKQVVALDPNNASMRKLNDDLTKLIK
jgi:Putative Zn-dependent protease, contains TPR repeats